MNTRELDALITRHIAETADGQLECPVNELARGQSTLRDYFILKIDIANSTILLGGRRAQTYVRLMHPFFSTIDAVCRSWGADPNQTEYQGDSVLALFPAWGNTAWNVLAAAVQCHYVCRRLATMSAGMQAMGLRTRTVLHFGALSVAVTGPYGESHRVAVGIPIHVAAKREKEVGVGTIWASDECSAQLTRQERAAYLVRHTKTETRREQVLVTPPARQSPLLGYLFGLGAPPHSALAAALRNYQPAPEAHSAGSLSRIGALLNQPAAPRYEWQDVQHQVNDGWTVALSPGYRALGIPLA